MSGKTLLRKALHLLAVIITSLILVVVVTAVSLLLKPSLIVNVTTLETAARLAAARGIEITWRDAVIDAESLGWLHKKIHMDFTDFCIRMPETESHYCFERYQATAEVAYEEGKIRIPSLGPVRVLGGDILITAPSRQPEEDPEEKKKPFTMPKLIFPAQLIGSDFHDIHIDIPAIRLVTKDKTYTGRLLASAAPQERRLNAVNVRGEVHESTGPLRLNLFGRLSSGSGFSKDEWKLETIVEADLPRDKRARSHAAIVHYEKGDYAYNIEADYAQGELAASVQTRGKLEGTRLYGALDSHIKNLRAEIPQVDIRDCGYEHVETDKDKNEGHTHIYCPVDAKVLPPLTYKKYGRIVSVPNFVRLLVRSQTDGFYFPDTTKKITGDVTIDMLPVAGGLIQTSGYLKATLAGVSTEFPQGWDLHTSLDAVFRVPEFANLVAALDDTWFAVPAPLNVLAGPVEVVVSGSGRPLKEREIYPVGFTLNLASPQQQIDMKGEGTLQAMVAKNAPPADLKMEVTLDNVQLALPDLQLGGLPQLFPDKRIKDQKPTFTDARKSGKLKYDIHIVTPPEKPVRLLTQFASGHAPVALDLRLTDGKLGGSLNMENFDVSLLHRKGHVDNFGLFLKEPREKSLLRGKIDVDYGEYAVDVLLLGTLKRPRVVLQSHPALPQEDIVSLLIYGRTFNETNTNESTATASVTAALADRALSLGALFALSSTPIRNFRYDPSNGALSARFNVGGGASITIGSNWQDFTQVGLRKSLGSNFIINTYVTNPTTEEGQKGEAFLEWSRRY